MESVSRFIKCFLICAVMLLPQAVFAHKVRIFAAREGDKIKGCCYFSGGKGVADAKISVLAQEKKKLSEVRTNEKGEFEFTPKAKGEYKFVFSSGDGHKAEATVSYEDDNTPTSPPAESVAKEEKAAQVTPPATPPGLNAGELRKIIAEETSKQLFPLQRELDSLKETMRFRDILGGIGFIFGLAGVAAFFLSKKQK